MKFKSIEMQKAYNAGDSASVTRWRTETRLLFMYTAKNAINSPIPPKKEYQDANGATYNTVRGSWIN